jgi:hypothetical protein
MAAMSLVVVPRQVINQRAFLGSMDTIKALNVLLRSALMQHRFIMLSTEYQTVSV